MNQVLEADKLYSVQCSFEDRHRYKEAGFEFNKATRSWETLNPFIANKVGLVDTRAGLWRIPADDHELLLHYQRVGVQRCVQALVRAPFHLLGDVMGLGKTPQAIVTAECLDSGYYKIAVICLANSRGVWHDHIYGTEKTHRWGSYLAQTHCDVMYSSQQGQLSDSHMICSYSLAPKILERAGDFDFIILDECQALSNPHTKQTKAVLEFCERNIANGAKVLGLSGTWPKNCPIELWPILNRIGPKMFRDMSYKEFAYRYCQPWVNPKNGQLIVSGFNNTEELNFNLRNLVMTRREVNEVRDDLPEPKFHFVQLEATHEIEDALKEEKEIYGKFTTPKTKGKMQLGEYASTRKRIAAYKAPLVAKYVREAIGQGLSKVCVFCHTVDLAKSLEAELSDLGTVRVTGETPAKKRDGLVEAFQTDASIRIFIGNIQAAGVAITLTAASTLFFAETSWVPGDNDQVIGRIRRHGQVEQVHVKFLVIAGSLDEQILKKAYWKKQGISLVLDRLEVK